MKKSNKRILEFGKILKRSYLNFGDDNSEDIIKLLKDTSHHDHKSYMAKPQLYAIAKMAAELHEVLEDNETLPDWSESHIAKCEQMLQSVYNKVMYNKNYDDSSTFDE
jgi:hypothetical protein